MDVKGALVERTGRTAVVLFADSRVCAGYNPGYANWLGVRALRSVGEAVTGCGEPDADEKRNYQVHDCSDSQRWDAQSDSFDHPS